MKLFKTLISAILLVLSLAVIVWSGYFLWSALPGRQTEPAVLSTEQLFLAEEPEPAAPPAPETAEQPQNPEEPAEPTEPEAPPAEEPPAVIPAPAAPSRFSEESQSLAKAYLQDMTLEEKLWQLFLVTPQALSGETLYATEATGLALLQKPVGGLVYFGDNLQDREQTQTLLANTKSYAWTPLFLAVDEEGGTVSRAGSNEAMGVTHFPAAATYGETADEAGVREAGATLAAQLGELGFNLDFAPVADIITNPNNTEIGSRAYSADPQTAAALVSAMTEGLEEGGMAACLKHFPGHGSTEADSHEGLSVSTRTVEELRSAEWIPFAAGIDAGASFVMVGHQTNRNLSSFPASLSPVVMTYLRAELGFEGIIITDSLQMGAIVHSYTSAQAAVMAIQAGADMLLMPNDLQTAYDGLRAAVEDGTISRSRIDESVQRILTVKYELGIME